MGPNHIQAFTIATGVLMIIGTVLGTLGQHTQIAPDGNPVIDGRLGVFLGVSKHYSSFLTHD